MNNIDIVINDTTVNIVDNESTVNAEVSNLSTGTIIGSVDVNTQIEETNVVGEIEYPTIEVEILGYANMPNGSSSSNLIADNETIEINNDIVSIKNKATAQDGGIFMKKDNEFSFKQSLDGGLF